MYSRLREVGLATEVFPTLPDFLCPLFAYLSLQKTKENIPVAVVSLGG
jgi:hypothetical protein